MFLNDVFMTELAWRICTVCTYYFDDSSKTMIKLVKESATYRSEQHLVSSFIHILLMVYFTGVPGDGLGNLDDSTELQIGE